MCIWAYPQSAKAVSKTERRNIIDGLSAGELYAILAKLKAIFTIF